MASLRSLSTCWRGPNASTSCRTRQAPARCVARVTCDAPLSLKPPLNASILCSRRAGRISGLYGLRAAIDRSCTDAALGRRRPCTERQSRCTGWLLQKTTARPLRCTRAGRCTFVASDHSQGLSPLSSCQHAAATRPSGTANCGKTIAHRDAAPILTSTAWHGVVFGTVEYGVSSGAPKPGSEGPEGESRSESGTVPQL